MKNTQDKFAVLIFLCLFSTKWQSTSANFPNEGSIAASIDKLTEIVERNQCKASRQNLGDRLIENVENSIFLHRKTSEQLIDLEQKVRELKEQFGAFRSGARNNFIDGTIHSNNRAVYFSVATAKRVNCYNCAINFELVKKSEIILLNFFNFHTDKKINKIWFYSKILGQYYVAQSFNVWWIDISSKALSQLSPILKT